MYPIFKLEQHDLMKDRAERKYNEYIILSGLVPYSFLVEADQSIMVILRSDEHKNPVEMAKNFKNRICTLEAVDKDENLTALMLTFSQGLNITIPGLLDHAKDKDALEQYIITNIYPFMLHKVYIHISNREKVLSYKPKNFMELYKDIQNIIRYSIPRPCGFSSYGFYDYDRNENEKSFN